MAKKSEEKTEKKFFSFSHAGKDYTVPVVANSLHELTTEDIEFLCKQQEAQAGRTILVNACVNYGKENSKSGKPYSMVKACAPKLSNTAGRNAEKKEAGIRKMLVYLSGDCKEVKIATAYVVASGKDHAGAVVDLTGVPMVPSCIRQHSIYAKNCYIPSAWLCGVLNLDSTNLSNIIDAWLPFIDNSDIDSGSMAVYRMTLPELSDDDKKRLNAVFNASVLRRTEKNISAKCYTLLGDILLYGKLSGADTDKHTGHYTYDSIAAVVDNDRERYVIGIVTNAKKFIRAKVRKEGNEFTLGEIDGDTIEDYLCEYLSDKSVQELCDIRAAHDRVTKMK